VNKIGRRRITVGMDGSLYKFHPHLSRRLKRVARRLVCDCILFDLVLAEDGSGRGAALAVAALDNK
jgi:hexokinase